MNWTFWEMLGIAAIFQGFIFLAEANTCFRVSIQIPNWLSKWQWFSLWIVREGHQLAHYNSQFMNNCKAKVNFHLKWHFPFYKNLKLPQRTDLLSIYWWLHGNFEFVEHLNVVHSLYRILFEEVWTYWKFPLITINVQLYFTEIKLSWKTMFESIQCHFWSWPFCLKAEMEEDKANIYFVLLFLHKLEWQILCSLQDFDY